MFRVKNLRVIVIGAVCVVLAIWVVVRSVKDGSAKTSSADYSDLIPVRYEIQDEDNAFTYLSFATNVYVELDCEKEDQINKAIEEGNWATNLVEEILADNEEMFEWVYKAVEYKRCQVPELTSFGDFIPYISKWRGMARLMALKAKWLARQGRYTEAFDCAFKLVQFGHLAEDSSGALINCLVGIAIKGIGLTALEDLICAGNLPYELLRRAPSDLEKYSDSTEGMANAFRVEFFMQCNAMNDVIDGRFDELKGDKYGIIRTLFFKTNYVFKYEETKGLMADHFRASIECLDLPFVQVQERMKSFESPEKFKKLDLLKPNSLGRILLRLFLPAIEGVYTRSARNSIHVSANRIMSALAAYKTDYAELPESLGKLAPEYIEVIPLDAYTGKQFGYSKERGILYSAGANMIDDGGDDTPERDDSDNRWMDKDVVFDIRFQRLH